MGAIRAISGALIILCMWGCSIQERAAKRVSWVDRKSPITLVQWCADNVPVRADTNFIPGKPIIIPGVIKYVDCGSVTRADSTTGDSGRVVGVPCPPSTQTVDTYRVVQIDTISLRIMQDNLDSARYELAVMEHENARLKGAKNTITWVAVVAGVVALIMGFLAGAFLKIKIPSIRNIIKTK